MPGQSPALPKIPPHPMRRIGSSRWATICFWTVLVLFLLLLSYLGLLAFTSYNGTLQSSGILQGPHIAGAIVGFCAIASLAAGIATRNQQH